MGRWNSDGDFPYAERHMRIENAHIDASDAARMIQQRFGLPVRAIAG